MPRVVVLGSGIGGSAAALLLARAGLDVTLLEKNPRIGGSCSGYEKRGFHVDLGTHMFCRGAKGPLGDVLRRAGAPGAIRFRRTRDIAEIRSIGRRGELVTIAVPASLRRMPRFAWDLAMALELGPAEAARAARIFAHILAMDDAETERWDDRTVDEFLARFTDHETILGVFGFLLGLYFILPFWQVSAGEALWCFRRQALDNALSYPAGGSIAIPRAYCALAERAGARVRMGAGAERVAVRDGRVFGVVLEGGEEVPADVVVSTSSIRTTMMRLVGEEHFPEEYVDRVRRIRGSYVAVQAKVALDRPLVTAGAIVGGVGDHQDIVRTNLAQMRTMFDEVASGRIPSVLPFYCPVPTNFDASLAPAGCQLLTACAVAPTRDVQLEDPEESWERALMSTLRRVVPDLDAHTLFADTMGTKFLEHWIGKEFGPAISTGQTPDQVGRKRPPVWTPIHGLYVCGCGAGARGVGTELAAASAMECADRVLADLGLLKTAPRPAGVRAAVSVAARAAAGGVRRGVTRPIAWATAPRQTS